MSSVFEHQQVQISTPTTNSSVIGPLISTSPQGDSAGDLDPPNSDSGVPSHSNSPDANSGMSGYSGGESSDHHTSVELELPSIGGEHRNPRDTPSPLFGSDMTGGILKEVDESICPYCHKTFRQVRF